MFFNVLKVKCLVLFLVLFMTLTSCKQRVADSAVKITNALETADYPAVFGLARVGDMPFCTATVIGPNVALTAAHCLCDEDFGISTYDTKLAVEMRRYNNRKYSCNNKSNYARARDTALIEFDTVFDEILNISTWSIAKGDALTLVGYGNTHTNIDQNGKKTFEGVGVKRSGNNVFQGKFSSGKIIVIGDRYEAGHKDNLGEVGENVSTLGGDSGSPLIVIGKGIVGVLQGGDNIGLWYRQESSVYSDLNHIDNRDFLRRGVKKGFQIPATCCACTKNYYKSFALGALSDHLKKVSSSPEIEVGDYNNKRLCGSLNNVKHDILPEDKYYQDGETRWYKTTECKVTTKRQCELGFDIEMLGS